MHLILKMILWRNKTGVNGWSTKERVLLESLTGLGKQVQVFVRLG